MKSKFIISPRLFTLICGFIVLNLGISQKNYSIELGINSARIAKPVDNISFMDSTYRYTGSLEFLPYRKQGFYLGFNKIRDEANKPYLSMGLNATYNRLDILTFYAQDTHGLYGKAGTNFRQTASTDFRYISLNGQLKSRLTLVDDKLFLGYGLEFGIVASSSVGQFHLEGLRKMVKMQPKNQNKIDITRWRIAPLAELVYKRKRLSYILGATYDVNTSMKTIPDLANGGSKYLNKKHLLQYRLGIAIRL